MGFSFIHTADIHLGRAFSDLSVMNDKIEVCHQACKKAFNNIIDLAIEKNVDFLLVAGDTFDSEDNDLSAKLLFIKNLEKLAQNGIKSYVICGNHDPIEMYKKYQGYFKFNKKYDGMINIVGVTTESVSEVFCHNEMVNIHAISFEKEEGGNPSKILAKVDSQSEKLFNIGLIHCDLEKTESKYAPCSKEDLRNLGYDYYALGHIHIPENREENIVYSGSPQGRTRKETDAHGCYYIKVEDKTIVEKEFIPTDVVRFSSVDIDCSSLENVTDVFSEILAVNSRIDSDVELNLLEVNLTGVTKAYESIIENDLMSAYQDEYAHSEPYNLAVYSIQNKTIPEVDEELLKEDKGVIGLIARCFEDGSDINIDEIYDEISEIHENVYNKLNISLEVRNELKSALDSDKTEILNQTKRMAKSLCHEIYSADGTK